VYFRQNFFSKFPKLNYLILSGNFILKNEDICVFYHYPKQLSYNRPPITLTSQTTTPSDICAQNYIFAINQYDCGAVQLPNLCSTTDECKTLANQIKSCNLASFENNCSNTSDIVNQSIPFSYQKSCLSALVNAWLTDGPSPTFAPCSSNDSNPINIGAVIGAIIGLIATIIILCITFYCIYRYRQNNNIYINSEDKYRKNSSTNSQYTDVSVATSKSSGQPLFPQNDKGIVVAPLYNVSQSSSMYSAPAASKYQPSAPRPSTITETGHLYEEVLNT